MMIKPNLLVEDDPNDREFARIALARANLLSQSIIVNDGVEALDYLFCRGNYASRPFGNPAVVMLDLKMPKIDGLEVLRAVRDDPETSTIPVVMLTSSRENQDLIRSYELGVNAFVVKPIEFSELITAIAEIGMFWAIVNKPPAGSVKILSLEI